ncbi:hypothetical protein SCHPADRAFT_841222, partial [Schizopora paradoxa]
SGSYDNTLRIWDAATGHTVVKPLQGHTDSATAVAYSPDGKHIVSGSRDKTLRIWNPQRGHWTKENLNTNNDTSSLCKNSSKAKRLDSDGWLRGHKGELNFWVPSDKRNGVQDMSLMTLPLAHPEHPVVLDCTKMVLGEEWVKVKVSRNFQ